MPKSSAQRMKELRQRQAASDPNYKQKESTRISKLQRRQRDLMSEEERNKLREDQRMKMRAWRRKKAESQVLKIITFPRKPFKSPQSFGKAVQRTYKTLPSSPNKKLAVVCGLAKKYGVDLAEKMECNLGNRSSYCALSEEVKEAVKNFYYRADVVWTAPGMRDELTVWIDGKKEKMRKYYLTLYLRELFSLFKQENPDIVIGFSKFASLRPTNVLLLKSQPMDQCKCIIHENFIFKLTALNITLDNFWENILCAPADFNSACWRGSCENCCRGGKLDLSSCSDADEVHWKEWSKDPNGRILQETREGCVGELKELLINHFSDYQEHVRIKRIMSHSFERDKADPRFYVLQIDFAMAYSCEYQNEIQSALWSRQSVNLFTAAVYDPSGQCSSHLIVTDSSDKGKDSVFTFVGALVEDLQLSAEEELIIYSDGPSSEFKNKYITGKFLSLLSEDLNRPITWKYFATSHGKGVVDGIGGAAKARVRDKVRSKGKDALVVQSAQDFANAVKKLMPQVHTQLINDDKIKANISRKNPWEGTLDIPGVRKIHVAKAVGGKVCVWKTALDTQGDPVMSVTYVVPPALTFHIKVGDWVVVKYDDVLYPGEVTNVKGKDTEVSVMVPATNTTWKWPLTVDKIFYQPENIIKKIVPPEAPCAVHGRLQFTFKEL
ncbi:uncharacterized protein [Apostichopus japonicus]|uniref:uncharacterized protein n=1 Tax=Stichopus japonicus TaxID=307972 RepID=UPI003AB4D0EB